MGNTNALRPDHLPPSQGGKYAGFGSTPSYSDDDGFGGAQHPSYGMSSRSAPTLDEFQRNPMGALSKGWGLFSSAVATASKEINTSVIQPGVAKAQTFAQDVQQGEGNEEWRKYLQGAAAGATQAGGWIGQRAGEGWNVVNGAAKERGVDLNEHLGKLGLGATAAGGSRSQSYAQLDRAEGGDLTPHGGAGDDDFFESWDEQKAAAPPASKAQGSASKGGKSGWDDDEWKDF